VSAERLPPSDTERIDRTTALTFTFDGTRHTGFAGDTLASALAAGGVDVFSRSFKYHRPRGLLCCSGRCPNCLVNVDGEPNVRACTRPLRDGATVRHQNAWPSLAVDVLSVAGRLERLLPIGFYYKMFYRPQRLWPYFERVLRNVAGLGRLDTRVTPDVHARTRNLHVDVAVVGGGPAGCAAALEAAAAGARVILIDDQPELGGHLRVLTATVRGDTRIDGLPAGAAAQRLGALVAAEPRIEVLSDATVFGIYEGGLLGATVGSTLCRIRARRIVLALGTQERPLLFENNDLPGIVLGNGALRIARLQGVRLGRRAIVVINDAHGHGVAEELRAIGTNVVEVIDVGGASEVVRALGGGWVSGLVVRDTTGERTIPCDLVAVALGPEPVTALFAHDSGARAFDERIGEFVAAGRTETVLAAGEMEGPRGGEFALAAGRAAGREAALECGHGTVAATREARAACEAIRAGAIATTSAPRMSAEGGGKRFVCLCEDVTAKEIVQGVKEGFDGLEVLKRYSTITMGPCQGKMCHVTSARLRAACTGESVAAAGLTTARPPFSPVTIGTLAGPHLAPVRRTALHERHASRGASWMDMGDWKRPFVYTSVERECRAVRESVAVIDVSTLGKLALRGPDAGEYLDWLHPNRFSDLKVGRVRYRAMCDDAGTILDDGTVARFPGDRFFVTTTTSGIDAVEQWLRWWLAGSSRRVHVANVTSEYAAINLAGPRSRDVLARLTALDVSKEAMPYLAAVEGEIAGCYAVVLRIGFVGELSYEIHVPADYGAHLWDALMEAGKEFDIQPFGVEAQRVLRLEKQHVIVGQDTDALSGPLDSAMSWLVKSDKPDFVGRSAIAAVGARGADLALVGFVLADRTVPDEGASVVRDGKLVGRVTSAKWSDTLGQTIGMAIVPVDLATDGSALDIRRDGTFLHATVAMKPFYDPAGAKLRS
jgi:sarcosine oxidase subunit alpha